MKKALSILLVACICLSFAAILSSCSPSGGVDNPYANYLVNFNQNSGTEYIDYKTGTSSKEQVSDFTKVNCNVNFYGTKGAKNSMNIYVNDALERFTNELGSDDDVNFFMSGEIFYTANSNTLKVVIHRFGYQTYTVEKMVNNKTEYEWKDGFEFNPPSDGTGTKDILILEYDISKYFENDGFVVADATVTQDFDMQYLTEDHKGLTDPDHTFTERNENWKEIAISHINSRVNAILGEVDKLIEAKSAN